MSEPIASPGADAALVVLGAAVWEGEMASPSLRRRAAHAAKLYKTGCAGLVVGSGGLGRFPPTEAEMIRRLLTEAGLPAAAVLCEDRSHTTLENVLFSARMLRARDINRVIVVSDKYHLPRAVICFRALGFSATGSGPDRADTGTPLRKWLYYYVRELIALPWYLIKLLKLRKSYFSRT